VWYRISCINTTHMISSKSILLQPLLFHSSPITSEASSLYILIPHKSRAHISLLLLLVHLQFSSTLCTQILKHNLQPHVTRLPHTQLLVISEVGKLPAADLTCGGHNNTGNTNLMRTTRDLPGQRLVTRSVSLSSFGSKHFVTTTMTAGPRGNAAHGDILHACKEHAGYLPSEMQTCIAQVEESLRDT
jgi:hypothetical protein